MMSSPAVMNEKYGLTEVEAHHFTYNWIIKNFKLLPQESGKFIYSPHFRVKENSKEEWKLILYPQGRDSGEEGFASLYLHLVSQDTARTKITVHCELSIVTSEGMKCSESYIYTYEKVAGRGFPAIIESSKLLTSCDSDDSITVRCKMEIPQRTTTKEFNPVFFDFQEGQLGEHFSHLIENSRFSDVDIIVGNERFTAHKVVLCKNQVKIEDLEPATVKGMLEFIYTDKVTGLKALARELLRASDKYELDRLKAMCENAIYETLTNDNAAEILVLSDLYHSHKLKDYVMAFIDGHLPSVVQSESYKIMVTTHPELLNELMCLIAAQRQQKT